MTASFAQVDSECCKYCCQWLGTRSGFGLTSAVVGGLGQGSVLTAGTGTLFGQQAAGAHL